MDTPHLLETYAAVDETDGRREDDYNVAPTKPVPVVVARHQRDADGRPTGPVARRLRIFQWGLVPSWAKDPSIGSRLINGRLETLADKPAFRKAVRARRCLLPADGYYEWMPPREPRGRKQPVFITRRDGVPLAMAGLYEFWSGGGDERLWTCTVVTTEMVDELGHVHDRSPVLIDPADWGDWLDPDNQDAEALLTRLGPAQPGVLGAYPVSLEVNDVRNNGPELLQAVTIDGSAAETLF